MMTWSMLEMEKLMGRIRRNPVANKKVSRYQSRKSRKGLKMPCPSSILTLRLGTWTMI